MLFFKGLASQDQTKTAKMKWSLNCAILLRIRKLTGGAKFSSHPGDARDEAASWPQDKVPRYRTVGKQTRSQQSPIASTADWGEISRELS